MASCSDFNFTEYLVGDLDQNAIDLRAKASVLYDQGKFDDAEKLAQKAFEMNSQSEEGGILLANIHMAQAGVDNISLAKSLTTETAQNLQSTSAVSQLSELSSVIGLTDDELSQLTIEGNEIDGIQGNPSSGLFVDYPVLLPKPASEARASGGNTIYHLSQAILALCKFVNDDVKVASDVRHGSEDCNTSSTATFRTEATFTWAFAHLSEAILFNNLINYPTVNEVSNLQERANLLSSSEATSDVSSYVNGVRELASIVDLIMPTEESENSMLIGMYNDLETTAKAFSSLGSLPDSLKNGVSSSLSDLQSQKESLESSGTQNSSASALKNQLNEGLSQALESQVREQINSGSLEDSEINSLCESYQSISTSSLDVCS